MIHTYTKRYDYCTTGNAVLGSKEKSIQLYAEQLQLYAEQLQLYADPLQMATPVIILVAIKLCHLLF